MQARFLACSPAVELTSSHLDVLPCKEKEQITSGLDVHCNRSFTSGRSHSNSWSAAQTLARSEWLPGFIEPGPAYPTQAYITSWMDVSAANSALYLLKHACQGCLGCTRQAFARVVGLPGRIPCKRQRPVLFRIPRHALRSPSSSRAVIEAKRMQKAMPRVFF